MFLLIVFLDLPLLRGILTTMIRTTSNGKRALTGAHIFCINCRIPFYVPKNRIDTAYYCSLSCKGKHETQQIEKECEVCGASFTHISARCNTAKYCSRLCYHRSQHLNGTDIFTCKGCDEEFRKSPSSNQSFCTRKCRSQYQHTQINKTPEATRKKYIKNGLMKECVRCGYDEHWHILAIHHIDRNPQNNKPENIEILCPICHSIEHCKHIVQGHGK